jgi:hypothetical protein
MESLKQFQKNAKAYIEAGQVKRLFDIIFQFRENTGTKLDDGRIYPDQSTAGTIESAIT